MPSEKFHPAGFIRIGVRHHMTAPISRLLYIQRQEAIHRKRFVIYGKFSIQVIQGTLQKNLKYPCFAILRSYCTEP